MQELRTAYFQASKKLHPDVSNLDKAAATAHFLQMTDAYELLSEHLKQQEKSDADGGNQSQDIYMTRDEEAEWRRACDAWVGVSAELVEELKADPAFREWLMLSEPDAEHWRLFLFNHGGLSFFPLRPQLSSSGSDNEGQLVIGKRRRKKKV